MSEYEITVEVSFNIEVEADSENEAIDMAKKRFWERIDDSDYPIEPSYTIESVTEDSECPDCTPNHECAVCKDDRLYHEKKDEP
jgi:uncharacterized protein (UPF0212 family)